MKRFVDNWQIINAFLIWRAGLFLAAVLATLTLPLRMDYLGIEFAKVSFLPVLWPWANFDGYHYLSIATSGYNQFQYAFFPGYPMLVSLVNRLIPDLLTIGFLISNIATIALLLVIYKLWSLDYGNAVVKRAILIFLAFPTTFYLGSVYTEALFLLLACGSLLAARKNNFLLSGILGGLASASRLVGIFLFPAMLIIWWYSQRRKQDLGYLLAIPLGLLAVMGYNYLQTSDPLYFFHVQPSFGANRSGREIILLPQVIFRYLKIFITVSPVSLTFFNALLEFVMTIGSLLLLVFAYRKVNLAYLVFAAGCIVLPALTGTLSSMPRYVLVAFLCFPALVLFLGKYYRLVMAIFLIIQVVLVALFTRGYWVA